MRARFKNKLWQRKNQKTFLLAFKFKGNLFMSHKNNNRYKSNKSNNNKSKRRKKLGKRLTLCKMERRRLSIIRI